MIWVHSTKGVIPANHLNAMSLHSCDEHLLLKFIQIEGKRRNKET
jgi:hypothetical protein